MISLAIHLHASHGRVDVHADTGLHGDGTGTAWVTINAVRFTSWGDRIDDAAFTFHCASMEAAERLAEAFRACSFSNGATGGAA